MPEVGGKPPSALRRVDAGLARVEGWLLVASLLGILGLGVAQIILRRFAVTLDWGDEVMRNLTLWVGFIGASVATRESKHINVDALTRFLKPKAKAIVAVVVDLAACVVTSFLFWSALKVFTSSIERLGKDAAVTLASGIPVAVWQAVMPVALAIIALRFLLKAGEAAIGVKSGSGLPPSEPSGSFAPHADPEIDGPPPPGAAR